MASETGEVPRGNEQPPDALILFPKNPSLKNVGRSRKSFASLESEHIVGVLDECIRSVELVALLPSELTEPESLSLGLGEEMAKSLTEHLSLVQEYQTLNLNPGDKGQEAAAKAVENSFLDVLLQMKSCPTKVAGRKGAGPITEDQRGLQELLAKLGDLRSVVLERLLTTPSEESARVRLMQELGVRHHINQKAIATLEKRVAMEVKNRDEETCKRNEAIRRLKGSLHQMEMNSDDFVLQRHKESEGQKDSILKTSEMKQTRLQKEINQMRVQLNSLITKQREAEQTLCKKKYNMETEIQNCIQSYDADMGEKQTELEKVSAIYEDEKAELRELQERYAVLELEYSQIMEERLIAQERREEEEREKELQSRAAVIIQAFWRGFRIRKAMKPKTKSKKAKKGKGKKGK